jgi:hypothetical protein
MNRFLALPLGLSVLAAGCGSSSPSAPSERTTATTTFTVPLSSANEVPAITNADAGSAGTAIIALIVTKDDSGAVASATMNLQISATGLPPGTTVTKAHIHNAAAGANGGILVDTALASGEMVITGGSGSITKNGINVPSDRAAAILNNPAGHYFNLHTALNPDGAIRGQLAGGAATSSPGTADGY